ncbi:PP2C family protein-serine/threonine phosphatase [Roseibium aestuarii]|uniref:PP2C family protein-serine/threonine phosphatase n=1 Tax=Roseibium aestuarii TaxID=2600299 RepID=A0ABW4K0J6_9HYPH|nr:response regulator [Roseibium aestuarii]
MIPPLTPPSDPQGPRSTTRLGDLGIRRLGDARILVVEDSSFARKTINAILVNYGFENVRLAADGGEGVAIALHWRPEVIITDLFMPVKTGFDLCRELRQNPLFRETPIIVQTSADTPALRGDVFEAGASDLINKPLNARELYSRLIVHLERIRLIESLKAYRTQMREELEAAKAMQMELLPSDAAIARLEQDHPVRFAWHSEPCQGLAGDIWDVFPIGPDCLRLWTADFTGHGVRSALNTFRLNTFMRTSSQEPDMDPAQWLSALNSFLCEVLSPGHFATVLCCDLDFGAGALRIASGGAPQPVVGRSGHHALVDISGMPLGISRRAEFGEARLDFGPGDCMLAYSDALTETPSAEDPLFTPERLVQTLDGFSEGLTGRTATLVRHLIEVAPDGLEDDLTLVFAQWRDPSGG